jgi:hypothetical protein
VSQKRVKPCVAMIRGTARQSGRPAVVCQPRLMGLFSAIAPTDGDRHSE